MDKLISKKYFSLFSLVCLIVWLFTNFYLLQLNNGFVFNKTAAISNVIIVTAWLIFYYAYVYENKASSLKIFYSIIGNLLALGIGFVISLFITSMASLLLGSMGFTYQDQTLFIVFKSNIVITIAISTMLTFRILKIIWQKNVTYLLPFVTTNVILLGLFWGLVLWILFGD